MKALFAAGLIATGLGVASHASADPLKILTVGDSITAGVGSTHGAGYRLPLQNLLLGAGVDFEFVGTQSGPGTPVPTLSNSSPMQTAHEGYPGARINAGSNSLFDHLGFDWVSNAPVTDNTVFDTLAANGDTPDVILLMIGTNDFNPTTSTNINPQHFALRQLLMGLEAELSDPAYANTKLLIAQIIDKPGALNNGSSEADKDKVRIGNDNIDTFNNTIMPNEIAGRSTAFQNATTMIAMPTVAQWVTDINYLSGGNPETTQIANLTYMDPDGIHPNDTGYNVMAQTWFGAIDSIGLIPEPGTAVLLMAGTMLLASRRKKIV